MSLGKDRTLRKKIVNCVWRDSLKISNGVVRWGEKEKIQSNRVGKTSPAAKLPHLAFKMVFSYSWSHFTCAALQDLGDLIPKSLPDGCKNC